MRSSPLARFVDTLIVVADRVGGPTCGMVRRTSGRTPRLARLVAAWLLVAISVVSLMIGVAESAEASTHSTPTQGLVPGSTEGDFVHISTTTSVRTASGHGWWRYSKDSDLRADVTVQLQVNRQGVWTDVGVPGIERVRPATGGSVYRANARVPCVDRTPTEWRSVIDVDIVGVIDSPEKLYTTVRLLDCGA
ncbi:hypothetical protein [Actinomycetospora termitidis]|uniref:Secreted protein n=1 Tax=Actinomycetospora termitidis TaxID=3053470 RepID=A0ABT7MLF5_9PSEU|nr:hypothetical protein [Actinomycetospora sp. Odt1-22]MDL5160198.1 hypothetical protein [Actinomycetospora sp. Odt1-22]